MDFDDPMLLFDPPPMGKPPEEGPEGEAASPEAPASEATPSPPTLPPCEAPAEAPIQASAAGEPPAPGNGLSTFPKAASGLGAKGRSGAGGGAGGVGWAWSDERVGRGWMFHGKMPTHMPFEFGEAMQLFWELMFFRSRWLISYKRELSQLVDEERYAEAFLLAMQYDMQRQTVKEDEQALNDYAEREHRKAQRAAESERERQEREKQERDEEAVSLQHLRDVVVQRRGEWREG